MAFQYYLYNTLYNNTLVERSDSSFAPLPPNTGEIYIDYFIPELQPLYFYREDNGLIVLNGQENIDEYFESIAPPPTSNDGVTYGELTGYTTSTFLKLDQTNPQIVSGGSPQFDGIRFNTSTGITHTHDVGRLHWNAFDKTLEVDVNDEVSLQIGQELVYNAYNESGVEILNGQLVSIVDNKILGGVEVLTIELTDATKSPRSLGMATQTIPNNSFGFVTSFGKVRGIDTNGYSGGTLLYLDTDAGAYSSIPPIAPYYVVPIGVVLVEGNTDGVIMFSPKFGFKISDMADVSRTGATTTGQILTWDSALGYYRNDKNINDYVLTSVFTGSTNLQKVTEFGSTTDVESTFSSGLITNRIKPTGDTVTAIQITKTDGTTAIINIDTVSGFTGFGINAPETQVHLYGTDTSNDSLVGLQTNAIRLDGVSDADKDIQWADNGVVKWLAEIYRNEEGRFWYLYNQDGDVTPLVVANTGEIGINSPNNIVNKYAFLNVNSGLDDIRFTGLYDKNFISIFEVEIDGVGTPDTFRWRVSYNEDKTFGSWTSTVPVSTGETLLESGVYVYFLSETGHTLGNTWEKPVFTQLPQGTFSIHPNSFSEILLVDDIGAGTIEYRNYTGEFNSSRIIEGVPILISGSTSGAFYVGSTTKLNSINFNINVGGAGITLITEYWNGTTWTDISVGNVGYIDLTNNLSTSGLIEWGINELTTWIRADIPDFDADEELFWVRFRSSSSVTKQPLLNNVGRNGNERLSIYSSPFDYKPAMYVDSLGRTNIGGGAITRLNKLQISTVDFLDVAVGSASLVEMDSNTSCAADLRIKLTSNDACGTGIAIVKTRGELTTTDGVETGDELGHIWFRSRVADTGVTNNSIVSKYTGTGLLGSYDGDLLFNTATNSFPTEKVRITAGGNTGFGISGATAVIHLKAGTSSNAPLKFTSGTLLSSPQTGAVEFLGNKYYGTTTGNTRNTFAFLESPEFTGTPVLPLTTELGNVVLNDYIWNSGGTNNPLLTLKSDFDTFTGSTVPWDNIDFSGSTLADLETRNAEDVNISVPHWDSTNVDDFTNKIADYIEDTQGSGRLSPEIVLSGLNTTNLIVFSGTGYISYTGYHSIITWSGTTIDVSEYVEGTYYVYVDTNSEIQISTSNPDGIHNIRLGSFFWSGSIIGGIIQCGCVILNSLARTINFFLRLGYFIYDDGGNIELMSGNTRKIISSPCKVQFGLLNIDLPEIGANQASNLQYKYIYISADQGVEVNWAFVRSGGIIPTGRWNDVTKNSHIPLTGYTVNFTSGSTIMTSSSDLTSIISVDNFIYLSGDSHTYSIPITDVTWTGSQTNIYSNFTYLGSTGSGTAIIDASLPQIPSGKYVKSLVVRTTDSQLIFFPAQTYYDTQDEALNGVLPLIPTQLNQNSIKMAYIVNVAEELDLTGKIYDIRPLPFHDREGGQSGGGTTITNHGSLTGLLNDDHPQYLRTDGTRALTGIQSYQSQPTFSNDLQIITKKYVDDVDVLKLDKSIFNTYTGTTVPNTYLTISNFNTYSGTTVPATYLTINNFNTYSGATAILIGTKQDTITGAATTITTSNLTIDRALISNGSGKVAVSTVTSTQLGYVAGVTSAIQTQLNTKAPLASPALTGTPTTPTAAADTSTTQIASTAFVVGQASAINPLMNGSVTIGTSLRYSRQDHVHPVDTSRQATITGAATTITTSNLTTDRVLISDGSGKVAVSTVTSTQLATVSARVYGTEYQLASALASTSTNSTTPVAKVTMTTTDLPSGTYKIVVHWVWSRNSAANSGRFNVTIGGVAQGTRTTMEIENGDTTDIRPETRIFYKALSGVNTIVFNHWGESTSNSTTTSDATIELIRVE